jgi:hypothetical protein
MRIKSTICHSYSVKLCERGWVPPLVVVDVGDFLTCDDGVNQLSPVPFGT